MRCVTEAAIGAREGGLVVEEGIIACGHGVVEARRQVSQVAQRTDDPPTALLEHCRNVRIAGRHALEKARLAALVGAIKRDPRKEENMNMDMQIVVAACSTCQALARPWGRHGPAQGLFLFRSAWRKPSPRVLWGQRPCHACRVAAQPSGRPERVWSSGARA